MIEFIKSLFTKECLASKFQEEMETQREEFRKYTAMKKAEYNAKFDAVAARFAS